MKKRGFFGSIIFWLNVIVVILLLISFVLPYLPPKRFPTLSLLSLTVSPLIVINFIFCLYWLLRLKKKFLFSLGILVIAYFHFNPFFEISSEGDISEYNNSLRIVSYNVRLFNAYEKKPSKNIASTISELIADQEPEVVCIQEYYKENDADFSAYQHQFIHFEGENKLGHAIFSKYPIIAKEAFNFKASNNNALFADIVKNGDTIRVYNLHLQSFGISPKVESLQKGGTEKLRGRIAKAFALQETQVTNILAHKATSPFPSLVTGDFNNTPFSYIYRKMQQGMKDAFLERGNGLGTTFLFDSYPMRIDYIFTSEMFDVVEFKTIKKTFSDHYPVSAILGWD